MILFAFAAVLFLLWQATPPDVDPTVVAQDVWQGVTQGHWGWVAAGAVVLIVYGIRKYGAYIPKVGPYLATHPVIGLCLPFVVASLFAMLNAMMAGQPMSAALLAGGDVALKAIVGYVGLKKVGEARTFSVAAAADAIPDKEAALKALDEASDEAQGKGPQP